ncbi:hypothetical protein E2C01_089643 [Portunus trituberculatus]|uniref:Uncharacterized protein n=1 Tax=Portunus trituberculatus TaxID=210409 RepID=A0A5B7JE40_PORTR|nr:hypothetical protein [Portunus trituberculatus]
MEGRRTLPRQPPHVYQFVCPKVGECNAPPISTVSPHLLHLIYETRGESLARHLPYVTCSVRPRDITDTGTSSETAREPGKKIKVD